MKQILSFYSFIILKDKYQDYKKALKQVNILKFAKKALRLEQFKKMFPVQKNIHGMEKRN